MVALVLSSLPASPFKPVPVDDAFGVLLTVGMLALFATLALAFGCARTASENLADTPLGDDPRP